MKAIVCTEYGSPDVLKLREVEKPAPKEHEVLVKVHAASVNILDLQMKGGAARLWLGLSRPKDPETRQGHRRAGGSRWQSGNAISARRRGIRSMPRRLCRVCCCS